MVDHVPNTMDKLDDGGGEMKRGHVMTVDDEQYHGIAMDGYLPNVLPPF